MTLSKNNLLALILLLATVLLPSPSWADDLGAQEAKSFISSKGLSAGKCSSGNDGKTYCVDSEGAIVSYGNDGTSFKRCEVLPVKLHNKIDCYVCPIFRVVYRAADSMAKTAFDKLGHPFALVLAVGLVLWISVQTLAHVTSLTRQDAPQFLVKLMKQSYKFAIAYFLLMYSQEIYTHFINPVLSAGLEFGGQVLPKPASPTNSPQDPKGLSGDYFTSTLYLKLETFILQVHENIAFMGAVGESLLCIGGHKMIGIGGFDIGNGFQMAIQGIVLLLFSLLLSLAFAFYVVDAVVQLGILGALAPFLIACWPFEITRGKVKPGVEILMHSFFVFVFIGIVVGLNLDLVSAALKGNTGAKGEETLNAIWKAINTQDNDALVEMTDISAVGFLILIICCVIGFKLCGQATKLAQKMAGGSGVTGIAPSIATMGASAATGMAKKILGNKAVLGGVATAAVDNIVGGASGAVRGTVGAIANPRRTWGQVKSATRQIGQGIRATGHAVAHPVRATRTAANTVGGAAKQAWNNKVSSVKSDWQALKGETKDMAQETKVLGQNLKYAPSKIDNAIVSAENRAFDASAKAVKSVANGTVKGFKAVGRGAVAAKNAVRDASVKAVNGLKTVDNGIRSAENAVLGAATTTAKKTRQAYIKTLRGARAAYNNPKEALRATGQAIKSGAVKAADATLKGAQAVDKGIRSAENAAFKATAAAAKWTGNAAVEGAKFGKEFGKEVGKDIADGVKGKIQGVSKTINNVGQGLNEFGQQLGEVGRDMRDIAQNATQSAAQKVNSALKSDAVQIPARQAKEILEQKIQNAKTIGSVAKFAVSHPMASARAFKEALSSELGDSSILDVDDSVIEQIAADNGISIGGNVSGDSRLDENINNTSAESQAVEANVSADSLNENERVETTLQEAPYTEEQAETTDSLSSDERIDEVVQDSSDSSERSDDTAQTTSPDNYGDASADDVSSGSASVDEVRASDGVDSGNTGSVTAATQESAPSYSTETRNEHNEARRQNLKKTVDAPARRKLENIDAIIQGDGTIIDKEGQVIGRATKKGAVKDGEEVIGQLMKDGTFKDNSKKTVGRVTPSETSKQSNRSFLERMTVKESRFDIKRNAEKENRKKARKSRHAKK